MSRIRTLRGALWRDRYVTCFDDGGGGGDDDEGLRCHGSGLIEVSYGETGT